MALSAQEKKQRAATAALEYLREGMLLGVGTGSTVNALIDQLGPWKTRLRGAVSSSSASTARLRALDIPVLDLNDVPELGLYIAGADEANPRRELIKGRAPPHRERSSPPRRAVSSASSMIRSWSRYSAASPCRSK